MSKEEETKKILERFVERTGATKDTSSEFDEFIKWLKIVPLSAKPMELRGKGFAWREPDGRVYLQRCFHCGLENWAMMVARGACAWCGKGVEKQ
jgi:hypothetical protein